MRKGSLFKKLKKRYQTNENYYLLELHIHRATESQKRVSARLFRTLHEALVKAELKLSAEAITEALSYENKTEPFTEEEILSIDEGVALVILKVLVGCRTEERARLAENAAHTLRALTVADHEARYRKLSCLEKYLRENDPLYSLCDEATRNDQKGRIARLAKKHRLSTKDAAALYLQQKEEDAPPSKKGAVFFSLIYAVSLLLTLATVFIGVPFALMPLLFFPVSELVKGLGEECLRHLSPSHPIPKLELEKIPSEGKTLVVITTLLTEESHEPFAKLERFYLANREENLYFGLILDYKDGDSEVTDADTLLADFAEAELALLNEKYGKRFFLCLRKRSYSPSERRYIGRERKRGAIIDFIEWLRGEASPFSLTAGPTEALKNAAYLLTLDADTNLTMGSVKKMVGAMLHPDNRPAIHKGAVRKGYGILQPRMAVTVESACSSRFSLLMCGSGGVDPYASATFDTYQNLFHEGIFCGKGIIDIDAFHKLIPSAFEEERILSHDLIEGNLLRAGFLSDVVLTDSFPAGPLSFFTRMHRWYRGDVQAMPYAFTSPRNAKGKRHKNPVSPLGKYKLFDNLRRLILPIASLSLLLLSLLFSERAELAVSLTLTACLVLPPFFSLFSRSRGRFRRYFSRILTSFGYRFMNTLFAISSLAHQGLLAANALFVSLFRMLVSKKRLLFWTTAARADAKKNSALSYLTATLPGLLTGIFLLTFAQSAPLRLFALSFLVFPVFLVLLAHRFTPNPKPLAKHEKAILSRYVFDMWSYFSTFVTEEENYLPPDNYQKTPVTAVAHRTSPTNIGMYLLSCLAARDFGYITSQELLTRTSNTLSTLEKMPKQYGHLYNWYDTRTLSLLGKPFISTVDSGNLVVSLLTLTRGLDEYAEEEPMLRRVIYRYERLIEQTDFSALYCEKRKLFYISRDSEEPSPLSCYDLYMSEARTTSYYAVACGTVPKKHWERLSRVTVGEGRYIGLASWSGTTFEYFMPHLFLPIPKSSLADEALAFAVSCQKKNRHRGLFGISESAYHAFDADMNYQYRAHGVRTLALDIHAGDNPVLSPYSSFLMLASAPHAALANLENFQKLGVYGEYGFYEAVDFSLSDKDPSVIKSFMSHHVGMSIVACANACFNQLFVRRFMSDPRMACAQELLEERIPTDAPLFRGKLAIGMREKPRPLAFAEDEKKLRSEKANDRLPKIALFSNRSASLQVSSTGEVSLFLRDTALTYPTFSGIRENTLLSSLRIVFAHQDEVYAVTPEMFSYSGTRAVFTSLHGKLTVKTVFTLHGEKDLYAVSFSASGGVGTVTPTLAFEPILTSPRAFYAHPFYRALSIEAFFDKEDEILYFRCRKKEDEGEKWLAVSCEGEGTLAFDSRKDILPLGYGEESLCALAAKPLPCRVGATVSPYAVMRRTLAFRMGKASADFLIASGVSRSEVREAVHSVRKKSAPPVEIIAESLRPTVRSMLRALGESRPDLKYAELYLSAVTFPQKSGISLTRPERLATLWQASISGDLPMVVLSLKDEESIGGRRLVSIFLKMHRLMRDKGVASDLIFLCHETDSYNKPISKELGRIICDEKIEGYLNKKGGVYLVSDEGLFNTVSALSCLYLPIDKNSSPEEVYYRVTGRKRENRIAPVTQAEPAAEPSIPQNALRCEGGYFLENSFTVIKSEIDSPHSFVYASSVFGTLVSTSSPGFTWLSNSKERRLSAPADDLRNDMTEERILAVKDHKYYDLTAMAHTVEYAEGAAIYRGTLEKEPYTVWIGVDRVLPVKTVLAELPQRTKLLYHVTPSFSLPPHLRHVTETHREGMTVFYHNFISPHLADRRIFLSPVTGKDKKQGVIMGIYPMKCEALYHLIRSKYHSTDAIEQGFLEYASHYRGLFSSLTFHLPRPELEVMLNRFVPYQAYVIRMLARSGYHQSGGAFGFRDQLQDALAMLYYDETVVKRQIFRAAAHQYKEGDVQHWWHPIPTEGGMGAGVRTRISDDMLWLPYAVAKYFEVTKDTELLAAGIAYLDSPPLAEEENDRYETPQKTQHKESVYRHCLRAIDASYQLSPRGLPLIGTGDWNDAFNRVGALGKGESIFLARFMQIVFSRFSKVAEAVGDSATCHLLAERCAALSQAVEQHAWEEDRYLRGTYDSGAPLGSRHSRECRIDIMAQSFSALAEGETDRTAEAMRTAYRYLYDSEHKLLKLFDPPFSAEKKEAGYISAYCEGIRENGGQYNHGALFAARGYFALGEKRKAYEILDAVNPCARSRDPRTKKVYRAEPYALCGDIYTNPQHVGRGGWSLYTGAAGWFLTTCLECLFGYREEDVGFSLHPALPDKLSSFSLRVERKGTVYHIHASLADHGRILLDGERWENRFPFDGGTHILEFDIEKKEKL